MFENLSVLQFHVTILLNPLYVGGFQGSSSYIHKVFFYCYYIYYVYKSFQQIVFCKHFLLSKVPIAELWVFNKETPLYEADATWQL